MFDRAVQYLSREYNLKWDLSRFTLKLLLALYLFHGGGDDLSGVICPLQMLRVSAGSQNSLSLSAVVKFR